MKSILKLFFVFSACLFLIIAVVMNSDRALADVLPDREPVESCCQIADRNHPGTV
mgnify:FL=1